MVQPLTDKSLTEVMSCVYSIYDKLLSIGISKSEIETMLSVINDTLEEDLVEFRANSGRYLSPKRRATCCESSGHRPRCFRRLLSAYYDDGSRSFKNGNSSKKAASSLFRMLASPS